MTSYPIPQWCDMSQDASFVEPQKIAQRASKFEKTIRRRNWLEYAAGVLMIGLFGVGTAFALAKGEWLISLSLTFVVAGVAVVLWNLYHRASNLAALPEEPCLHHLRRQYEHQMKALRAVPIWYIGPLVPGMVMFYVVVTAKVAERVGWTTAIQGAWGPAAASFGFFVLVIAANLIAARHLKRKIDQFDKLA